MNVDLVVKIGKIVFADAEKASPFSWRGRVSSRRLQGRFEDGCARRERRG